MPASERQRGNAEPATRVFTADQVAATVDAIFFANCLSVLDLMCAVGEAIVHNLFRASLEDWKRVGGGLPVALVAAGLRRRGSDWTSVRLQHAVRLYEQREIFGGFGEWSRLPAGHFVEVQGLPTEQQRKLLTMAQQENWGLQQLRSAIDTLRARANKAAKQAAATDSTRLLDAIARLLDDPSLESNLGTAGVPRAEFHRFEAALEELHAELDSLRDRLTGPAARVT